MELDGDCRFYSVRVMNKDDYYAKKAAEEVEKAENRSHHAKIAADAKSEGEPEKYRFSPEGAKGEDCAPGRPRGG